MSRLWLVGLVALVGSCMPAFDPATADLAWILVGEQTTLFDHQIGDLLDYAHGEALELITIDADGSFELSVRNCAPGDFVVASGRWEPISPDELRLVADAEFGQICCPRDTLIIARRDDCQTFDVWAIDDAGERVRFGVVSWWTRGDPCLAGCCSFDGGVCDPTVELCSASACS